MKLRFIFFLNWPLQQGQWFFVLFRTSVTGNHGLQKMTENCHILVEEVCHPHSNHVSLSRCECLPGYVGQHCEQDYNDCLENKCQHGAECVDAVNGYTCVCREGFRWGVTETPHRQIASSDTMQRQTSGPEWDQIQMALLNQTLGCKCASVHGCVRVFSRCSSMWLIIAATVGVRETNSS